MDYILNIHTTSETAIVNLAKGSEVLTTSVNSDSRHHAAFLHTAIDKILQETNVSPSILKAIGVTGGPGSYTGIRVGLATAKGLCFALKIPMIMMNTLEVMAFSAIENIGNKKTLYCPMIDARRMEVFTAVYDSQLKEITAPEAVVLDENSFKSLVIKGPLFFFGSGAAKFAKIINNPNANYHFAEEPLSSSALGRFAWNKFLKNEFDNISNSKPLYVKEFYSNSAIR